ncbi:MAG: nuclear transport factor 2 family protein [Pedobacter sp.]|nr:nuclear transport factor 2 family protein [Pedobacter sp.]MDQ8053392.1 nuclear transport factor 2 family protein [Pedobacter sp.]
MKLKSLVMMILGIVITAQTYADPKVDKPTKDHQSVLNCFVKSYLNTDYKMLKEVLSRDAVFTSNRYEEVVNHDAEDILALMKQNNGVKQENCQVNSTVLSQSDAIVIARVDVHYELFEGDQQNFVVIEKNKAGEWRITKVYKIFVPSEKARKVIAKN